MSSVVCLNKSLFQRGGAGRLRSKAIVQVDRLKIAFVSFWPRQHACPFAACARTYVRAAVGLFAFVLLPE